MSIIGEAFVAITPIGTGFASKVEAQVAASGFAGNIEKQMANAGVLGGNAFTRKLQGALKAAGISGGEAIGVAIALGAVAGLAKIGSEFEAARRRIAQETGATGEELAGLFDTVKQSVLEVPASLDKAAIAVDELFRRGVPLGKQLDELAKQELFLAKITKNDLATTVEDTTGLMAKFNVPIADQSRELDVLFKGYQNSGKGLSELTSNLQKGGGVLQSFGFNLDKSVALLSALEKAGVNLGPALAGLRLAFGKIVAEGGDPQKVLADLIREFTDGTPKAKAMADAIELFGKRSGAELSIAISKGKFDVAALLKEITDGRDGIVATGEATLSLGDRFTLLRNRIEEELSGAGLAVRRELTEAVVAVGPPIIELVASIGRIGQAAAPAAVLLAPLVAVLGALGPGIGIFAAGLDTVASGLDAIPGPALAVGVALGVVLFASDALIASLTTLAARAAFVATEFAVAHPAIAAFVAIVATIGVVSKLVATQADPAIKQAKAFGDAAFDASSKTGVFRGELKSTSDAFAAFLKDQQSAGKLGGNITAGLLDARTNVKDLASAVSGGQVEWEKYRDKIVEAAKAADPLHNQLGQTSLQVVKLSENLDDQRQAFQKANKDELTNAVVLGQITPKLELHIKNLHRGKDGTVDFGAAVNDLNKRLADQVGAHNQAVLAIDSTAVAEDKLAASLASGAITDAEATSKLKALGLQGDEVAKQLGILKDRAVALNQEQDRLASSAAPATAAYGELTREIARGTITQHDAVAQLHAMGFSLEGAGTAFSDLQSQVKSFIDGAVGQLPTVGQAISDFAQQITEDESQLASDKKSGVELREKLDKAIAASSASTQQKLATVNLAIIQDQQKIALGSVSTTDKLQKDLLRRSQIVTGSGKASAELRTEIEKNNAAIIADNKKLADDNNPNKFTQNLLDNAAKIVSFTANLQKLVTAGLAPLAAELAKQGPDAAAGLAAGLANAPAKAAIAEKAVELGKTASDNFRKFLENNAPELIGTGAKQGLVIGKAIADGITKELLHNFPLLRTLGITTGDELIGGAKETASKSSITDPILVEARKHIPEFRGLGIPIGTTLMDGAKAGAAQTDLPAVVAIQLAHGGGKLREAGASLGVAAGQGIADGIRAQFDNVGNAVLAVTQHGVAVAKSQWKVTSPSRVFAEIGAQAGEGLALGISGSTDAVGLAASRLATSTEAQINAALDGVEFDPSITPTITPKVGPLSIPPIDPQLIPTRVAPVRLPDVAPLQLTATLRPLDAPDVAPVTVAAHLGPIPVPSISPVTISASVRVPPSPVTIAGRVDPVVGSIAPVRINAFVSTPVVPPITVHASLGSIPSPRVDPVLLHGNFAPVAAPAIDPVSLSVTVPPVPTLELAASVHATVRPIDPVAITGTVTPTVPPLDPVDLTGRIRPLAAPPVPPVNISGTVSVTPPRVPGVVVAATLGPIPTPSVAPVTVQADLGPIVQPRFDPVVIDASVAQPAAPVIPAVVVPASLSAVEVPRIAPVVAPVVVPPIAPVTVTASLSTLVVPPLPPAVVTVAPLTVPPIPPVVVSTSLSPVEAPAVAPVTISATIEPKVAPIDATPVGRRLGDTVAAGVSEGIASTSISDRLNAVATEAATSSSASFRNAGLLLGKQLSAAQSTAIVDPARTPGQGLVEGFDRNAAQVREHASALARFLDGFTFVGRLEHQFASITDAKTTAGFVTFASNLVDTFHQSFEKIAVDASQLQTVLDALTEQRTARAAGLSKELLDKLVAEKLLVTKFAPPAPPSAVSFRQAFESLTVPRPEDRANAQTPRDAPKQIVFHATFNEKVDPLHVASELAWQLL